MQAIKNSPIMDIKNTINKILGDNYLTIKDDVIISWDRVEGLDISIRDNNDGTHTFSVTGHTFVSSDIVSDTVDWINNN
jgi:hypothetical protein